MPVRAVPAPFAARSVDVVVGNVYVCAAVPVNVELPVVKVCPFTVVGVISPRVKVIAGVVVEVATEPETPFAVTTETDVTVPDPGLAHSIEVAPALTRRTCPAEPRTPMISIRSCSADVILSPLDKYPILNCCLCYFKCRYLSFILLMESY